MRRRKRPDKCIIQYPGAWGNLFCALVQRIVGPASCRTCCFPSCVLFASRFFRPMRFAGCPHLASCRPSCVLPEPCVLPAPCVLSTSCILPAARLMHFASYRHLASCPPHAFCRLLAPCVLPASCVLPAPCVLPAILQKERRRYRQGRTIHQPLNSPSS